MRIFILFFSYTFLGDSMDEIELALLRHKQRSGKEKTLESDDRRISKAFTKILLSIILVLGCTIYIKLSPDNLSLFKSSVFESSITFTKFNNWYHSMFGNILPSFKEPETQTVSSNIEGVQRVDYLDGYKIKISKGSPIKVLASGLLVYLGEKEGYGNVAIIQGVDGVDIWYGGITDLDIKMYDYIETNAIIGNAQEDFYYLLFVKDGQYLKYEEYLNQV